MFRVSLPIAGPAVTIAPVRTAVEEISSRVLVVDDEVLFTNALRRLLGPAHELTIVNSAEEALALFDGGSRFEAVLAWAATKKLKTLAVSGANEGQCARLADFKHERGIV